ncbi:gamma-glutamyltransferase [Hyphomonas jannaschiana]|uniref:Glutathione hydrolase proenzyme n=1 Tax=Hyphomonas jannaschiana VP2 TaxID=1280952 RepID=A0A059F6K6_9PROT|nr:gamma-glutamyltransferase [Hyphomonas jannaschiana]KCZ83907.1 gamma-glutamyltransferase [Hyphomonas jannaschiana VP2]
MKIARPLLAAPFLAALLLSACAAPDGKQDVSVSEAAQSAAEAAASETTDAAQEAADVNAWTKGAMVAAANPEAVEAGLEILREGGTAVDAAIAVHTALGLVEPESSGIGGGGFMVYYDHASGEITVFDGRERAPAAATPEYFMKDGEVMDFISSWQSGRSVGVPGAVALYKSAHDAAGKLDWEDLFQPAIKLAEDGFVVERKLAATLASDRLQQYVRLDDLPESSAYFYPDGVPLAEGSIKTNPAYAETLKRIATEGPSAFYSGEIAESIAYAVSHDPSLPGAMTVEDLANYEVAVRPALCGVEPDGYKVCSAPPPSSGGVTQNMILGLYDRLKPTGEEATEEGFLKAFVDAQRLTYADRDHYVADADFVPVPAAELIDPIYLDVRATEAFAPDEHATPGDPGIALGRGPMRQMWGEDPTDHRPGTTHFSIIDPYGNAVSMTMTVESAFGNSVMVHGFVLNNQLTDFSREPTKGGKPVANAVAGNKRPRSSMSPTLVFDPEGDLFMVTGSPGGNSIVAYVAKTLVGVLEWGKSAQEAINLPNIIARGDVVGVEVDREGGPEAAEALREMGYNVEERQGENSGLHVIIVREDGLEGGADPRRDGVALALE